MTMEKFKLTTPVAFIFFNRPDTTMQVLKEIRRAKPDKLYLISDGAREGRSGEAALVEQLRHDVEAGIDWECNILKNYAPKNMGCRKRMASGITWVLEQEETTIILEDDIIVAPSFFRYCQELLNYYKDDDRVAYISGNNIYKDYKVQNSYLFSKFPSIWGWATWRRAWNWYDDSMEGWEEIKKERCIEHYYGKKWAKFYIPQIECAYTGERDTWDYQWEASRMRHGGLGIIPKQNLVENIGFNREDATHTRGDSMYDFTKYNLVFPLQHPSVVENDTSYDRGYQKHIIAREFERLYFWGKVRRRLRLLFMRQG